MSSYRDHLIAIQRNQSCLRAIISRCSKVADEYELVSLPLPEIDKKLFAARDRYVSNWQKLIKCDLSSLDTLMIAMEFITETVQSHLEPGPLARSLDSVLKAKVEVKATAANPRAYKGTKKKPPKQTQSSEIDLRPYLCNLKLTRELVSFWQSEFQEYFEDMEWQSEAFDSGIDPHHWTRVGSDNIDIESLPSKFKDYVLPCLSEISPESLSSCCTLYWHLALENNSSLMALFVRILCLSDMPPLVMMFQQLMILDPSECPAVLKLVVRLLEGDDFKLVLEDGVIEGVHQFSSDAELMDNLSFVLQSLSDGIPFNYLKILLRLKQNYQDVLPAYNNQLRYSFMPNPLLEAEKFPGYELDLLLTSLAECKLDKWDSRWPEGPSWYLGYILWEGLASHPYLVKHFKQVPWKTLHPCVAQSIALFFYNASYMRDCEIEDAFAAVIESHLISLLEKIARFEDFEVQVAFAEEVRSFVFDVEKSDLVYIDQVINLVERSKSLIGASESNEGRFFLYLVEELTDDGIKQLFDMPDSTFKEICRATKRVNDARLIRAGLNTVAKMIPEFVLSGLRDCPAKILKVAKIFGCTNKTVRIAILKEFQNSSIFKLDESSMDEDRFHKTAQVLYDENCANQIPKKLKQYLDEEINLTDNQLKRALNLAKDSLILSKVEYLERFAYSKMAPGVSVEQFSEKIQHALKIMHQNKDSRNYRAFKKFFNSYMDGEHDYLLSHPRNLEWVSKKDSFKLEYWIEGFEKHYEEEKITLKLETDPFEALKLGTHVGSCFGSGGNYSDCAMAAVMDINKQVVYALNARNKVVARQILAISDENKLLKFRIYPEDTEIKYASLFNDFSDRLSQFINVEIYKDEDNEDYSVANLIAASWYDDGLYEDEDSESKKESVN